MKITTNVFGPETRLKREVSVDLESPTLGEVLTILASQDDTALKRILRADLSPEEGYVILVNGRNASSLNRLETRIEDGDEITFTVLLAGG
jgi:molybdopterin converting factor small subunit